MPTRVSPSDWEPKDIDGLETNAGWAVRSTVNALVFAGPGSGKTEMLAQRACYLLETGICSRNRRILAISFKRDAARNLRERVESRVGSVLASSFDSYTFDAFAKSLLDNFRETLPQIWRPTPDYEIDFELEKKAPLRDFINGLTDETVGLTYEFLQGIPADSFYKQTVLGVRLNGAYQAEGTTNTLARKFWHSLLKSGHQSVLTFPMISRLAELVLIQNPHILKALRTTYQFVFLDEFQDTTGVQYSLTKTAFLNTSAVLTAVGDTKQCIMGWAGAVPEIFVKFRDDFAAVDKPLLINWRSGSKLVEIQKHLISAIDPDAEMPESGKKSPGDGECRTLFFDDYKREAEVVADMIRGWIHDDKISPREICVLTRGRPDHYSETLRAALADRDIAARVENELQDLLTEPVAELILNAFAVASRRQSPAEWMALVEQIDFVQGLSEDEKESRILKKQLSAFLKELGEALDTADSAAENRAAINSVLAFVGADAFAARYPQYARGNFLQDCREKCVTYLTDYRSQSADWSEAISKCRGVDAVPIMTIHKSKGLEYHSVVFIGLEDGALWGYRDSPHDETCAFFVAFSRAKERVVFTYSRIRLHTRTGRPAAQSKDTIENLYGILESAGVEIQEIE